MRLTFERLTTHLLQNPKFLAAEQAVSDSRNPDTRAINLKSLNKEKEELTQRLFAGAKLVLNDDLRLSRSLSPGPGPDPHLTLRFSRRSQKSTRF